MKAPKLNLRLTSPTDPLEWARRLRSKEFAGVRLLEVQANAWRVALRETAERVKETDDEKEERLHREAMGKF